MWYALLLLPIPVEWLSLRLLTTVVAITVVACRRYGTHRVLRWPIFIMLVALIAIDLVAYTLVRLAIRALTLRKELSLHDRSINDYASWLAAAEQADRDEGRDAWRREPETSECDWRHLRATTERLHAARKANDHVALLKLLAPLLKNNAHGELEFTLYTRARAGTKLVLEAYRDEVCACLRDLAALRPSDGVGGGGSWHGGGLPAAPSLAALRYDFCVAARASLGNVALVLSGGALFGVRHFGVIKALLDQGMLPQIICGASGAHSAALDLGRRSGVAL